MRTLSKIVRILLPVLLFFLRISVSEAGNVIVTSLTANEGLSNNTVWAIMQDSSGYVWIGTAEGLDRFDGKEIRHFSPDRFFGENHIVRALCEDDSGRIWVGTYSGILVFDPVTERLEAFHLGLPEVDDAGFRVYQIIKDPVGKLWIPAGKYGFLRIDPRSSEVKRFISSSDGSVRYYGAAMCFDGRDTFYLVLDDGNVYSSSDELSSVTPMFPGRVLGYQPNKLAYAFGCLFTGEAEDNIKIDIRKKEITRTPWSVIRVPVTEPNDELLASNREGFHILDSDLREKQEISMDAGSRLAFQGKSIMCACRDRDGNFWVGTYYSGVFHLINNRANLRKFYPRYADDAEPSHVSEIIPDSDGTLWVATEDKGLLRFSPEQGSFSPVKLPISVLNITALGSAGPYLWIGAFAQFRSLARLDRRNGTVILYEDAPPRVGSICPRRDGSVAIGAVGGLYIFKEGRFFHALRISDVVRNVMEDSHGHLWISTGKEGLWLCQADPLEESAKWVHFEHDPEDDGSIPSNRVTSAFEDRESRIWVTTEFGGFCLLNPRTGRFTRYVDQPQTDYKVCYKISEDRNGLFWITTSKGLLCFNPQTRAASLLTRSDGLLSNQYNYSSNNISPEGVLYVGSGDGLASFEPDKLLQLPSRKSGILLTNFQVIEPRKAKRTGFSLPGSINFLSSIVLPHRYNSFRIKVVTDNYSIPVVSRLVYRLEGVDSEWTDIQDGLIEINKLPSGRYRLNIRVERIDGGTEPDGRVLEIQVKPPVMAGPPAVALYLLLFLSAFWLFRWWLLRSLKKQQERELLSAQLDFVTTIAHEIKTPLTLVQGSMELLSRKTLGKEEGENLDVASRNVDRIRELVSQLQDFSSIQARGLALGAGWINLTEEADMVFHRFVLEARSRQKRFSIQLPDHAVWSLTDRDAVDKIMTNLFSNAIKYADSFATVTVSDDSGRFRVSVVNDGIVVPREMAKRIFEPFVRYNDNSQSVPGTGIGLYTGRKLARMLGGDVWFRQNSGGLNEFVMDLPLQETPTSREVAEPGVAARFTAVEPGAQKTILVAEDTPEMKAFIVGMLKAEYKVIEASDGDEALKVLSSGAVVNLILSDVMMPGIDGFELCRKVKENIITSHIPVILLTAKSDIGSKIEGLEYGADMYLEKPFSPDHLKAAIASVFENREKLRMHYLSRPLETDAEPVGNKADSDFLKRFVTFVEDNIENESLRIADIASAVYVSESNLYKKTRDLIGMTPLEYVQYIRLKVAESLLSGTDLPISDIVARTGFRSHPYFSACFKKQYGMTPGQYRKNHLH